LLVTKVPGTYQCAETESTARGTGRLSPRARKARDQRLSSIAFMGEPCPTNTTGRRAGEPGGDEAGEVDDAVMRCTWAGDSLARHPTAAASVQSLVRNLRRPGRSREPRCMGQAYDAPFAVARARRQPSPARCSMTVAAPCSDAVGAARESRKRLG